MSIRACAWWKPTAQDELLDITLGALLDQQSVQHRDRCAVIAVNTASGQERRWSYHALAAQSDDLARGLIAWGVGHGDHVAVMSANRAEWVLLEYALAKIGAVLVTVNPALHMRELTYLLVQGEVSHLIFADRLRHHDIAAMLAQMLADAVPLGGGVIRSSDFPALRAIAALDSGLAYALPFAALGQMGVKVTDDQFVQRTRAVTPDDVLQIQYTSGTTGKPKGAMLSHRSTVNNARLMGLRAGFAANDVLLSAMPLFHTAGCVCNVMSMLACGGCVVVLDSYDPGSMLAQWERHGATIINGVPTMYSRMLDHPDFTHRDTGSLRIAFMGGTAIPPSLMARVCTATQAEPMIIMGMTECSPIITQTDPNDPLDLRYGTAGIPLPHTEIRICDPDSGAVLDWGEKGELCIRGYLLTLGYFNMPDITAQAIDADGWLHSGDLAVLDRPGHLQIVGRLKDMIIRGGENVFPVEIEDFLLEHPGISQAQVIGVTDPDLGEEICAFVLLAPGATLGADEIQALCRANLARHKLPKYVHIVTSFPMTPNGKIQKYALRDIAQCLMQEDACP
ncbi:long-chain fatty acid--CoA ligase [Thioclava sp. SK-1]|uniref:AMP-binding protein n=1 Tax=Thioclava sp. SK-1 TaxID=1889770 RepID=UPI0008247E32|nr:AMP-binding protein [Thioclava sp. SK-1]OCX64453.1 long-chain fatty acid--CoA ligase [Thioclava sp. SK-1]